MKLAKMSMVAALLLGANAFAIENVKVNGDAKLFYGTADQSVKNGTNTPDMFDKAASYGDAALNLGITADLTEGVSAGVSMTAVSTLGLENNLVSQTWSNSHSATVGTGASYASTLGGVSVDDEMWVGEAWLAGTAFDTTLKAGRQAVDTPLAFSENWGIDQNTFEGAVLLNQSIPDTTIVAAWLGKSNGSADETAPVTINALGAAQAGYVSQGGKFNTFAQDGAYAAGIINNSVKPLTAQAWYYDLQGLAEAYWLQADLDIEGVLVGAQYASVEVTHDVLTRAAALALTDSGTTGYAVMAGYAMKDVVTLKAAYSSVDDDGILGLGNTATTTAQSKLYTEMWWNYGAISAVGADSYSITAEGTVAEVDLLVGYYSTDIDPVGIEATGTMTGVDEIAVTASKSFGPLDASVAVIFDDYTYQNTALTGSTEDMTSLQVYLTYNF